MNVATLVEYGTADPRAIQLQEVGFSRAIATELLADHSSRLRFSAIGELEDIDEVAILAASKLSDEARAEVTSILLKVPVDVPPASSVGSGASRLNLRNGDRL